MLELQSTLTTLHCEFLSPKSLPQLRSTLGWCKIDDNVVHIVGRTEENAMPTNRISPEDPHPPSTTTTTHRSSFSLISHPVYIWIPTTYSVIHSATFIGGLLLLLPASVYQIDRYKWMGGAGVVEGRVIPRSCVSIKIAKGFVFHFPNNTRICCSLLALLFRTHRQGLSGGKSTAG